MREKNNEAYKIAGMLVLGSLIIIMALAIGKACKCCRIPSVFVQKKIVV